MKDFKYEYVNKFVINNKVHGTKKLTISLTGEYSHEAIIEPGQGSFGIGVKGIDSERYIDVWVNKNDKIRWESFNRCEIQHPERLKEEDEFSGWPRWFYYTGNDIGFIEWSQKRAIEGFTWCPQREFSVDFSKSIINELKIHSDHKLYLTFGDNIEYLDLYGNPENFIIEKCNKVPSLGFYPKKENTKGIISLPKYDCFCDAEELLVEVDPNGAPFDCKSILQFPNLKLLHLVGNVTNLTVLKELKHLNRLGFWNAPDLTNLPTLDSWKELKSFVAMNIDENIGRRLKEEIRLLKKNKQYGDLYAGKLRNKLWFETEYGLPFSNWDSSKEKKATSIYKKCLKAIKAATNEEEIHDSISEYTSSFNKMKDIETVEREDIYAGLVTIMKNSPIDIKYDVWFNWFDEARNF